MKYFTLFIIYLVAACLGRCSVAFANSDVRLNVVLIMADDLGYETLGVNGGESYETPVLDRLAAEGARFNHCYVQPLCTPTRVQLMTGLYNVRNYVEFGLLDRSAKTFGNFFQDAGYKTGVAGKWQLGRLGDEPALFGFAEHCLWQHVRKPPRYANPGLEINGEMRDFTGGEYGPDIVNDFACDFIRRHRDEPFFLYYPMILTHAPFQPTPDSPGWDPKAMGEKGNRSEAHFADMVAYMDKLVGRLADTLEECGLRERTLLLFLGDNGTGRTVRSRWKGDIVRGGKGKTTLEGMHVPLIASWPATIPPGVVCDDLIDSADILPTICEAAGVPIPAGIEPDGRSFLPQLRGESGQPRQWIYSWYAPRGGPPTEFAFNQRYKLYRDGQFFDLANDPKERAPQNVTQLRGEASASATILQSALDRYANARPEDLRAKTATQEPAPREDNDE
jgi:arylsulfatase A